LIFKEKNKIRKERCAIQLKLKGRVVSTKKNKAK
jgi:hypothetical protein